VLVDSTTEEAVPAMVDTVVDTPLAVVDVVTFETAFPELPPPPQALRMRPAHAMPTAAVILCRFIGSPLALPDDGAGAVLGCLASVSALSFSGQDWCGRGSQCGSAMRARALPRITWRSVSSGSESAASKKPPGVVVPSGWGQSDPNTTRSGPITFTI